MPELNYPDVSALPWTDFHRVYVDASEFDTDEAWDRYRALAAQDKEGRTAEDYRAIYQSLTEDECYRNSRYLVFVRRNLADNGEGGVIEMVHLSVKRHDQQTIHDWRDMQRIKNALLGPNCEAVELYPAEDRVVDTANQYHMWGVNDGTFRWPLGWNAGQNKLGNLGVGEKQRPFEIDVDDETMVDQRDYKVMWQRLQNHVNDLTKRGDEAGVAQEIFDNMLEIEEGVERLS